MTKLTNKKQDIPPSRGEDNALQGYEAQYAVASELILKALHDRDFECAILKDSKAEKVDDIQIVSTKQVNAYQVKWHVPPTSLTYSDLKGSDTAPENGLVRQLADGWLALVSTHPDKEIFVHLHTTSNASTSSINDIPNNEPPPRHLAEFINAYWKVAVPKQEAVEKWQPLIQSFQTASGLTTGEFEQFRLHCKFDLNRRRSQDREEYNHSNRYYKNIEHLQSSLLRKAGQTRGTITLKRQDILDLAGWNERFEFKVRHEFPTPTYYVPIVDTVQKLEHALDQFKQGYLALIGTPGSGKSTLLTRTLRYRRNIQVFRYYCFVPDDTALSRGEAYNFLHDLVLTLSKKGIRPWGYSMGDTIEQLRTTFEAQIQEIGNLWKEKGIHTIVLVDGLDHIKRESNPQHSLINELPQPSAIPEGCVFVLGTQHIEQIGLKTNIEQELRADSLARTITMGRLERRSIREIISKMLPGVELQETSIKTIESRSAGHPLALNLILNRLHTSNPSEINEILAKIPEYEDNIERNYAAYWQQLENDDELRKLLALFSRIRGTIDLNLMSTLASEETLRKLVSTAKHYFTELPELRWRFFHNSFRQFILDKTGRNAFGIYDENAHRGYHAQLAKLAGENATPTVFQWERLYHTFHSGDYERVIEMGTQEYFRNQFFSSRPAELIVDDTKLVIKAAREQEDILSAIRVLLIESELNQRSSILEECDIYDLLLRIGKPEEAIKHVLFEGQLFIEPEKALDFAYNLVDAGHVEAAKEIFEMAEPLDKFSGSEIGGVIRHGNKNVLEMWVHAATRFLPLEEIKKAINCIEVKVGRPYEDSERATKNFRTRLFIELADAIIKMGGREELEQLPAKLSDVVDEKILRQRIAFSIISSEAEPDLKDEQLNYLLKLNKEQQLPEYILLRVVGALLKYKNNLQSAKEIFDSIEMPKRVIDQESSSFNFGPYIRRLRYYRLSAAIGNIIDPIKAVPDATQDHQKGSVLIERMVIRMANIWGKAWRGEVLPPSLVIHELLPAFRIIERWDDQELRLFLTGFHETYLEILIYSAAAHGKDALAEITELIENHWLDEVTSKYWYKSLRRNIALTLYRAGGSREELFNRLTELEPTLGIQDEVSEFLQSCTEQISAWVEIDQLDRANTYISPMIKTSFGLYHEKDTQIYYWSKSFQTALERKPEHVKHDFKVVAQGIATASASNRGSRAQDAAISLLSSIAGCAPDLAEKLKQCFWNEDVLNYLATLEALLIAGFKEESVHIEIPLTMLRRLYLPYIRHFEEEVLEAFIENLVKIEHSNAVILLQNLVEAIELEISPHLCGKWWEALDENLRVHSQVEPLLEVVAERLSHQKPKSEYTKGSVTLNDGQVIEEDDLLEEAKSPETLINILDNIKEDSFYHWYRIVNNIIGGLTKVQTEKLLNAFTKLGKSGRDVSGLISKLHALGSVKEAEKYALNTLEQSKPYGWSYSYDGGSRIEPYKILIKINEKYHRLAFKQFIDDYLEGSRPYYLYSMLDDLVDVFWSHPPIEEVWKEIFGHFSQLQEFTNPSIKLSEEFELRQFEPTALTRELIWQIIESYEMPQPELREDAYNALVHLYNVQPDIREQILDVIDTYLDAGKDLPLLGAALIRGLLDTTPELIDRFYKKLEKHLHHDDMAVRLEARKILAYSHGNLSIKRHRPLPASYTLELPEFETMADNYASALVTANAPLPETNDSLQLVSIAQEALETIQNISGLDFRNLVERTALLMKKVVPLEEWNSTAEKVLLNRCRLLGIETSYRRPRTQAAIIALGHVISELYDAELLSESDLFLLEPSLSLFSLKISQIEPTSQYLSPITSSVPGDFMQRLSEWENKQPDILSTPPITNDGWTILGFVTKAETPIWENPTEIVSGSICSPYIKKSDFNNNPEAIIPGSMMAIWWLADHYPNLPYLNLALNRSILIKNYKQRLEIGRASWLAINPIIAHNLGWSLNEGGLFEWCNSSGKVMVKSEWWRNGRLNRHAPAEGVRAEGWITKASPKGFEALEKFVLPAKWVYGVKKKHNKKKTDSTWVSIFELT